MNYRDAEVKLGAYIRQLMRAREADDQIAVQEEARFICSALSWLLSDHLKGAPSWDSSYRWIDGMIGARLEVWPPDRIAVRGQMVWGLLADAGGPQWAEPFEAEVRIGLHSHELHSYWLRFGDKSAGSEELPTGSYATLAGPKGEVVFRPMFPSCDSQLAEKGRLSRSQLDSEEVCWVYQFCEEAP